MIALLLLVACSTVPPGHVVLADHVTATTPGDRFTIIHGGRYWGSPSMDYYELPTMEQRSVWAQSPNEGTPVDESLTFAGKDGQAVNVDVAVGFQIASDDADIIRMVQTYGPDLNTTVDGRVRDSVRSALGMCAQEMTVEDIYGEKKGELFDCALKRVQDEYGPKGLNIVRLTLNSEVRLPDTVKAAMEKANAATQQAFQTRNEVESTKAEGEKKVAAAQADAEATRLRAQADADATLIRAKAQAEANRLLGQSATPNLVSLRDAEARATAAEKWNGTLPTTMLGGTATPMVNLGSSGK